MLEVLRAGKMSGKDVTQAFEREYAQAIGMPYALGYCNGTAAIHAGLYALGVGVGHEVIMPSLTYWASGLQVYSLGATPVFAEVDPDTLCIDPADIAKRISPNVPKPLWWCIMPACRPIWMRSWPLPRRTA